jgi:simple sugar transport system ATP-binding protein
MQSKGIATLFVSHKLDECCKSERRYDPARREKIGTYPSRELDDEKLTMLMTGKKLEYTRYIPELVDQVPLLEVKDLGKRGSFQGISLTIRPGEILGITGLLGSGRTELALALFGANPADEGEIYLNGRQVSIRSVQDAVRLGIGYVPENRMVQGLVMQQPVGKNIVLTTINQLCSRFGLIVQERVRESENRWVRDLAIKIPSIDAPVQTLSGGNQQRVVLSKWIATNPRLLVLDGPTIGIDVAAKQAIHEIIRPSQAGIAILLISDEVPEVCPMQTAF